MKVHVFRELVNVLRDVAVKYHDHQSLKERIAYALIDALLGHGQFRPNDKKVEQSK